jgi:hypothetical protein
MNRLETWRIRAGVQCTAVELVGSRLLARQIASGLEATVKVCGVVVAMLSGQQVGASLVDRCAVNVGTIHRWPRLDPPGRGRAGTSPSRWLVDGAEAS